MKVVLKIVAALFAAIAAFLIYCVIAAVSSAGGAKPAVCAGYVAGAIVLCYLAGTLWRKSSRKSVPSVG